ncbi:MAG: N-acetyltransferase [Candidatus Omnitrophica bacterium]|nr:N-acetyltransferase [Candidatus Omnitrophota bacterium]MDE2222389.1 N-acetyltransferase [Candidatus Omnitrophota bacterium]
MSFFKHERAMVHPGAKIGEGTRIWANANVMEEAVIGSHCNVGDGCYIEKGAVIGSHVTVKNGVAVFDGVTIEDDAFISFGVAFINDRNPRSHRADAWELEKTLVQKGATIGANATVMCGITIGAYAVVGAGSVVVKDVPAYTIVVGNPARRAGYACRCGRRLNDQLKCACGASYQLSHNQVIPI